MRLNKLLAQAGICSRRAADKQIIAGNITVNGKAMLQLGYTIQDNDIVKYKNKTIIPENKTYILLNKPKNTITTLKDPQKRKTVVDIIHHKKIQRIYPVGRLDRNTTGLLLLTNDGILAQKLSHPSSNTTKIYQVTLTRPLLLNDMDKIKNGLLLHDGIAQVDHIYYMDTARKTIRITMHSGKNRIIRRIFEYLSYTIKALDRTIYGPLTKKNLPYGQWRFLYPKEIQQLLN